MKRFVLTLIAFVMLFPLVGQAKVYKVEDVPMVHLKDGTRYVCNPDTILSPGTVAAIDSMMLALEQATGIEVVVMVLTDIEGGDCFQFALTVGEKYGVGKKETDNGFVVLLSTEQRCIQFVTGYGLEGDMPDAICKRIQEQYMNPYFAKGEWDQGMLEGMKAVQGYLGGTLELEAADGESVEVEEFTATDFLLIIGMIIGGIGLYVLFIWLLYVAVRWLCHRIPKRCPQCNERALRRMSATRLYRKHGKQCHHVVYTCSKCGHTEERDEVTSYGVYGGGGHSAHRSGGSSRGGSFGGGSFGGGGAGSRF